jgi:hypothetical protein
MTDVQKFMRDNGQKAVTFDVLSTALETVGEQILQVEKKVRAKDSNLLLESQSLLHAEHLAAQIKSYCDHALHGVPEVITEGKKGAPSWLTK